MPKTPRGRVHTAPGKVRAKSVYDSGIRFQNRGKYRCIKNEGKTTRGVHPTLKAEFWPQWNYDRAVRQDQLITLRTPAPATTIAIPSAARDRRAPYSLATGRRMDQEITATVKYTLRNHLSARFWYDPAERRLGLRQLRGVTAAQKTECTRVRNLTGRIMPETMGFWALMHHARLDPVSTQTDVAHGRIGTRVDVVCQHRDSGQYRVIECKCGCEENYTIRGLPLLCKELSREVGERHVTRHTQSLLQTRLTHLLFRSKFKTRDCLKPWLVRIDRRGAHVYVPPEFHHLRTLLRP